MAQKQKHYLDYIREQCPGLPLEDAAFNFLDGTHSDLVTVNKNTVFRFPKYDWSTCYLTNAARAVRLAGKHVEMTLPNLVQLEGGTVTYRFLPGRPLLRRELVQNKSLEQYSMAKQIGLFLTQLHSIPVEEAKAGQLEDRFSDKDHAYWENRCREIQKKLFPYCDHSQRKAIRLIFRDALETEGFFSGRPAVIHGNLSPLHILYNEEKHRISAITGFGSCCIGDPAIDTGCLLACYGKTFVLRAGEYDPAVQEQMERAKFYAALQRLEWAEELTDRITTRDFTNFRIKFSEPCLP
ncbi:MAG: phosphotransferase [Oscillospiraceae bacterium]|jgi:aminoglycoside 2''-phosphotransferase|nr:phosphotransferase [Oscillospiraceae bacterium]